MLASPCLLPFALPLLLLLSLTSFLMSSLLMLDPQAVLPLLMLRLPPHLPSRLASFLPLNQARPRRGLRWVVFTNNMSEWSSLHPSPKCAAWTTTHQAVLQRCYQLKGNHHAFRHGQRHLILLEVQHHPRLTANEAVVNPCVCGAVHTAHGIFPSPHAVPRSPPAIGAPSVGRLRRGSSYISTGVLRVPSVASPFTAHTAECTGSQRPALRSCCPHPRRSRPLCRPLSRPGSTRSSHHPEVSRAWTSGQSLQCHAPPRASRVFADSHCHHRHQSHWRVLLRLPPGGVFDNSYYPTAEGCSRVFRQVVTYSSTAAVPRCSAAPSGPVAAPPRRGAQTRYTTRHPPPSSSPASHTHAITTR